MYDSGQKAMEVDAIYGSKGHGKGGKKGIPQSQWWDPCKVCGKPGHQAKDCWHKDAGGKGKSKGSKGSKGTGKNTCCR